MPLQPAAAVFAHTERDVLTAVLAARRDGRRIRVNATGHGAAAQSPMHDSVLIRAAFGTPERVDPITGTAKVPAGATWAAVVEAAAPHGVVALHSSSPTVGVVGYLLGGGISFYGRKFGVAANRVRAITVILSDGRRVTASDYYEPELFWALRGGAGGFGVVVEVEIDLFPVTSIVTGSTYWDAGDAESVAQLWAEWSKNGSLEATTSLRLMNLPLIPGLPTVLTGRQILVLDGAVMAQDESELDAADRIADDLLAPLRSAAPTLADTWHHAAPRELTATHQDPLF